MQVTGDAISDIVNLVNKSSLSEYLTELYEKKQLFIRERSELNRRLSKFQEEVEFGSDLIKISEDKLNALNQDYVVLLVAAREMNRQNNKTLGQSLGSPHRAGSLIPKRGILIILLSVVAGGLLAVGAALLMPDRGTTKS
jgi:flagellar biosynthesis/type III secretory pathway chaperone